MMRKTECYVPVCDVCGKDVDDEAEIVVHYDTEAEALDRALDLEEHGGAGCQMVGDKLCCPICWMYDDDDEIVIREKVG